MPEDRRDTLKIIGAIGATCLFPFQADELYGQHDHASGGTPVVYERKFFNEDEFKLLSVLVDEIIPPTDTPGASAAGVPAYIDYVATRNAALGEICRDGLAMLSARKFGRMKPAARVKMLRALCESAEVAKKQGPDEKFWIAVKNLTADGYYTSKSGMGEELGFKGGSVLAAYPNCDVVPEH
jgi:hypothetical protein